MFWLSARGGGEGVAVEGSRTKIAYILFIVPLLIGVGAVVFHYLENWDWLDSVYFAVTTITTVGYGDLIPKKPETKIFIIFYILVGVGIMLYGLSTLGQYWVEKRDRPFGKRLSSLRNFGRGAASKVRKPPTAH